MKWRYHIANIPVEWCKKVQAECCEAFMDCGQYNPDWTTCDKCTLKEIKVLQIRQPVLNFQKIITNMLTLSEIALEEMERIAADGHLCGDCGGRLNVAFINGQYVLRCGNSLEHKTITRHDTKNEERIRKYRMDSNALMKLDERTMAMRVEMARFPQQLSPADKHLLNLAARTYGFDPVMGEMTIFQGHPYVSIDGRRRKAQETKELDGTNTLPATPEERKAQGVEDGDYLWKCEVWRKGTSHPFVGWGRVRKSEIERAKAQAREHNKREDALPIVKDPNGQAEVRAEHKALRKGFHIPLPGIEDIGSGEETPDDPNIIESTAKVLQNTEEEVVKTVSKSAAETTPKPTYGEALTWCLKEHHKDKKWFLDNCGFTERELQDEPVKVENAIQTICQITGWKWEMPTKGGS